MVHTIPKKEKAGIEINWSKVFLKKTINKTRGWKRKRYCITTSAECPLRVITTFQFSISGGSPLPNSVVPEPGFLSCINIAWSSDPDATNFPCLAHLTQLTDPKWSCRVARSLWEVSRLSMSAPRDFIFHMRTCKNRDENVITWELIQVSIVK